MGPLAADEAQSNRGLAAATVAADGDGDGVRIAHSLSLALAAAARRLQSAIDAGGCVKTACFKVRDNSIPDTARATRDCFPLLSSHTGSHGHTVRSCDKQREAQTGGGAGGQVVWLWLGRMAAKDIIIPEQENARCRTSALGSATRVTARVRQSGRMMNGKRG